MGGRHISDPKKLTKTTFLPQESSGGGTGEGGDRLGGGAAPIALPHAVACIYAAFWDACSIPENPKIGVVYADCCTRSVVRCSFFLQDEEADLEVEATWGTRPQEDSAAVALAVAAALASGTESPVMRVSEIAGLRLAAVVSGSGRVSRVD